MGGIAPTLLLILAAFVADGGGAGAAQPEADKELERGRDLYRIYCATCHGEQADGKGPTAAALKIPPPALTGLSRGREDGFPSERIHQVIDGRIPVGGHGSRSMPIWGIAFQELNSDRNQEQDVRRRIEQLIAYLRSIQVEN